MSEFKGTKGEWEVKKIHGDLKVIVKGSYEKLCPGMVSYRQVVETENKHDAKLIAASPALLDALQSLHDYVVDVLQVDGSDCSGDHPLLKARAAIGKAK